MNPQEIIEQLKSFIKGFASKEESISLEFFNKIKPRIIEIIRFNPSISEIDELTLDGYYDVAVKEYKSVYPVDIDPSSALTKKGFQTWLTDERKERLQKDYIERYLRYMRNEGRSDRVISELSRSSESILSKLGDPQSASGFYTKGLVVGSVQSGKTGNFNAVINRAVDAGYNLIIIFSGIMEDLRSQTQLRLELDVIGDGVINLQTEQKGVKGVGKIKTFGIHDTSGIPQVQPITSHKTDFKASLLEAGFSLNNKNILVCKKNTSVLKNLLIWLRDYLSDDTDQHNIPLLIVDDEADNASLNNLGHKGREYSSIINGHIRAILGLFSKRTYLGYTATPFANVLQDRNEEAEGKWPISYKRNGELITRDFNQVSNIFPDDFIELLEPPSNYIGAKQIFETVTDLGTTKIPLVEPITDFNQSFPRKVIDEIDGIRIASEAEIEDKVPNLRSPQKDELYPEVLPQSLIDAIECFILGIAIRLKRRPAMVGSKLYNPHNTMLLHISRFIDWQNRTKLLVQDEVDVVKEKIRTELPAAPDSIYARLEKTWNKYFAAIVENIRTYLPDGYADEFLEPVKFDEIKSLLPEAVKGLEVRAINSITKDKLIYSVDASGNGKKYIAIGGNRLSRGFTLEGLTINYFLRDTNFADSLLQMGRWFGYRPGYIDCCKLFTTWDAIEKYDAATRTIEELELEFKKMHRLGKTPEDFIIRVRTHPGVLKITRPSILKNAEEVNWSYQDTLFQTTKFELKSERIKDAWSGLKKLFAKHKWYDHGKGKFYVTDTDINGLFSFLDCPNTFYKYNSEFNQIKSFLMLCKEQNKMTKWKIAIKGTGDSGNEISSTESGLPGVLELSVRSAPKKSEKNSRFRKELIDDYVFTGSGKSANIVSAALDMSLWLQEEEIKQAEKDFIKDKTEELKEKWGDEAESKAAKLTKPERIYREKMSDETGLLVIYLMDLRAVLPDDDGELKGIKEKENIDDKIPLAGYAIAFPRFTKTIGGTYVRGKYNIEEDEPAAEEFDEETLNQDETE